VSEGWDLPPIPSYNADSAQPTFEIVMRLDIDACRESFLILVLDAVIWVFQAVTRIATSARFISSAVIDRVSRLNTKKSFHSHIMPSKL
jgi:hypothetical protein